MSDQTGVIIGCGAIAREHLKAVADLKNVKVIGVCDLSPARAETTAERFSVERWYTDFRVMLDDFRPDLVHITTPPATHFPIARYCLDNGYNVFCEKPITVEIDEFQELKRLANEKGRMLMENQNFRFHSSVRRIQTMIASGDLGEVIDVQVSIDLGIVAQGSPYIDANLPHFGSALRGGVIGDFLPHIAYLASMFVGPIVDLRTNWRKRSIGTPLPADEFRALLVGQRATAFAAFRGNCNVDGFWLRVIGTNMQVDANLFEPPRVASRRFRRGEPALKKLVDGLAESRAVFGGTLAAFWRKLAGTSSYDGVSEIIARSYASLRERREQPIPLEEIGSTANLVARMTRDELKI